jgi:glycyl-tRNA synthetase beta chain
VEDVALAQEVAGLVEWPVVLMGSFDESFLTIPPEVIRTTIRANQKCFVVRKNGKLTNKFIITANIEASDGGEAIIAGNERVIRARLSDAKFFFETDKAKTLESRLEKFKTITYHKDIGSQYERIERIAALAVQIGHGLDPALVRNAAKLAKADLVTEMVGEFPELEGLMGKYYYQHENPNDATDTANAIEQHYRPKGPSDKTPDTKLGQVIAMADKLDQLIGFWKINEKPTGSKDPFALRRAALGIIRIVLETGEFADFYEFIPSEVKDDLMKFMLDRFKTQMVESGKKHDVIDAVMANNSDYNFKAIAKNIESLSEFISQDTYLLPLFNRVNNILKAEEKKGKIDFIAIDTIDISSAGAMVKEDLIKAKAQLNRGDIHFYDKLFALNNSWLFQHFTDFFTNVMINSDIPEERLNRLSLLAEYRRQCLTVADFTKIVNN